jgi:hypothetical protein
MAKQKLSLDEALSQQQINTFEGADAKAKEHQELKAGVTQQDKKAGRPTAGQSKATNKIAFVVDDEQLAYLESLTSKEFRTPNAVAKKLFLSNYELHKKV